MSGVKVDLKVLCGSTMRSQHPNDAAVQIGPLRRAYKCSGSAPFYKEYTSDARLIHLRKEVY